MKHAIRCLFILATVFLLAPLARPQSPLVPYPWTVPPGGLGSTLSFSGTGTAVIGPYAIPQQASTINVLVNALNLTVGGSFQIETSLTQTSGFTNCGSAISVSAGQNGKGTCAWSATQPWQFVEIVPTGTTGTYSGTVTINTVAQLASWNYNFPAVNTASCATGYSCTNSDGVVAWTTGSGTQAAGFIVQVNFFPTLSGPGQCVVSPWGSAASEALGYYVSNSNVNDFQVFTAGTPAISTTYQFSYHCGSGS